MPTENSVPAGYHSVQPYLIYQDAQAAMNFYKSVFGATERLCMKDGANRIVHGELVVGDSCIMLADESPASHAYSAAHYGGCPISLMVYVADCDATYHSALAHGASSTREPADQAYGDRSAGIEDPFGYRWYLATHIKDLSREELEGLMKNDKTREQTTA